MNKLLDILNLFRKGSAVANPEIWKDASNAVSLLVPLMMAVIKVLGDFGYGLKFTAEEATSIAAGLVAAVQFVVHNVSSEKAGILPPLSPTGPTDNGTLPSQGPG